jgi:type II secretory pathway component PulF
MSDLKIPNFNKNSDRFFLKKKLSLRRKSKGNLIKEAFVMFSFSIFIFYINYLIPNKIIIFDNFINNIGKLITNILDSISYSYEISLAIFIVFSLILALILMLGAFTRIMKIVKRKSRQIRFK